MMYRLGAVRVLLHSDALIYRCYIRAQFSKLIPLVPFSPMPASPHMDLTSQVYNHVQHIPGKKAD